MELVWKKASSADLEMLTESRAETLRAANCLSAGADMEAVRAASRSYYAQALECGTHAAYLVFDGEKLVGTGGVSFFEVMPTVCNPSGKKSVHHEHVHASPVPAAGNRTKNARYADSGMPRPRRAFRLA